jgi:hypothetical protein
MSEIAKIKVAVTPSSGQEVGTCHDRLGLQGFRRRIRAGLGRDSGGDRAFQIHGDDRNYFSTPGLHIQRTAVSARNLSGNSKKKRACATIAGRNVNFRGLKHNVAEFEEHRVIPKVKSNGFTRTWLKEECLAGGLKDDGLFARSL